MGAVLTGWSSHHFSAPISLISIMPLPKGYKQGGAEAEPVEEGSRGLCGKEVDKEVEWIEGETNYVALGSVNRGRASSHLSPPPASADAGLVALGAAADRCACHCTLTILLQASAQSAARALSALSVLQISWSGQVWPGWGQDAKGCAVAALGYSWAGC